MLVQDLKTTLKTVLNIRLDYINISAYITST